MEGSSSNTYRTEEEKLVLRSKFVTIAKKYIGVPYKKKYHEPSSPEYDSDLFLDCCALVRRVQREMQDDFGFRLGPGNQAYQYDVLPECIDEQNMEEGDLVFISGTYYNEKSKAYPHNMVHVEIWLGDGEKTIGARWKRGKVQIHDSYQFKAESYHSMKYHFKSIDSWLNGICKSYCDEHKWERDKPIGRHDSKYSIFSIKSTCTTTTTTTPMDKERKNYDDEEEEEQYACATSDDEDEEEDTKDFKESSKVSNNMKDTKQESEDYPRKQLETKTNNEKNTNEDCTSSPQKPVAAIQAKSSKKVSPKKVSDLHHNPSKTFFIGGKNGVAIIENYLSKHGLKRTEKDEFFFLKWTEVKRNINYNAFDPSVQIVNHIQKIGCMTTKVGLVKLLRESDQRNKSNKKYLRSSEFFMKSYIISNLSEYNEFKRQYKEGEIWICKPSGRNQGKGIFLVTSLEGLQRELSDRKCPKMKIQERIIQKYIKKPLLINGFKFDIRVYMLIASTCPYIAFYHKGYVRLSCVPYTVDDLDIHAHLTNQFVQRKHPSYKEKKEESVMDFNQFNEYINHHVGEDKSISHDWVFNEFTDKMKSIMLTCLKGCMGKLDEKPSTFELLGFDFMIDENMKVWLIEVNINPALHTNCHVLKETIPPVVHQTLDIELEIFNKRKKRTKLGQLDCVTTMEPLYNGFTGANFTT
ncbi:protein polyglycylase TTLL10-like isoform X2 [Clytia hemisphaerica]